MPTVRSSARISSVEFAGGVADGGERQARLVHHAEDLVVDRCDVVGVGREVGGERREDAARSAGSGATAVGLDAELRGLLREELHVLVLLGEDFLLLRKLLELEVDVACLGVLARMEPVDLDPELGDAVLIGRRGPCSFWPLIRRAMSGLIRKPTTATTLVEQRSPKSR